MDKCYQRIEQYRHLIKPCDQCGASTYIKKSLCSRCEDHLRRIERAAKNKQSES